LKRVTGIGGIFFKANDPNKLAIGIACTLASNVKKKAVRYSSGEQRTIQTRSDAPSGRHFQPTPIISRRAKSLS
jgi:hypothetical protein